MQWGEGLVVFLGPAVRAGGAWQLSPTSSSGSHSCLWLTTRAPFRLPPRPSQTAATAAPLISK